MGSRIWTIDWLCPFTRKTSSSRLVIVERSDCVIARVIPVWPLRILRASQHERKEKKKIIKGGKKHFFYYLLNLLFIRIQSDKMPIALLSLWNEKELALEWKMFARERMWMRMSTCRFLSLNARWVKSEPSEGEAVARWRLVIRPISDGGVFSIVSSRSQPELEPRIPPSNPRTV